ncbi:hypothetical protein PCHDK_000521800, partial [Plasmodium chabaudi adami]
IVSREYCKYLCLFEKQSVDPNYTPPIKKYALGAIFSPSKDTNVIVCPSRTINDDTEINQETDMKEVYFNVKPIETDIDPEDALTKLGANISGFVIKRGDDDQVHVTYINAYNDLLEKIWDFDENHKSDSNIIRGIVSRVYWKYLFLFEKQSIDPNYTPFIKKYALGAVFNPSKDTNVIVCPSRTINDDTEINQETDMKEVYFNVKPIETDIDPEDALTKLGANISGFVIKRGDDDQVHVTYINAVYDVSNSTESIHNKRERGLTYANILSLAQRI